MRVSTILLLTTALVPLLSFAYENPPAPEAGHRPGLTLYVSKLGDNSDGRSWGTAFQTIQAALDAIPDDLGGHRLIIRPDTYA